MKKFLSLTLILCMLIITLGGCSSGDDKGKTADSDFGFGYGCRKYAHEGIL